MYRLVLKLPFQVTLVHREVFLTEEEAQAQADRLPNGFVVQPSDEADLTEAVLVPFKTLESKP